MLLWLSYEIGLDIELELLRIDFGLVFFVNGSLLDSNADSQWLLSCNPNECAMTHSKNESVTAEIFLSWFGTRTAYNPETGIVTDAYRHQDSTSTRGVLRTHQKSKHPDSKQRRNEPENFILQKRIVLRIDEFWIFCVVSKKLHWLMNLRGEGVSNVLDWSQSSRIAVLQWRFVYFVMHFVLRFTSRCRKDCVQ